MVGAEMTIMFCLRVFTARRAMAGRSAVLPAVPGAAGRPARLRHTWQVNHHRGKLPPCARVPLWNRKFAPRLFPHSDPYPSLLDPRQRGKLTTECIIGYHRTVDFELPSVWG